MQKRGLVGLQALQWFLDKTHQLLSAVASQHAHLGWTLKVTILQTKTDLSSRYHIAQLKNSMQCPKHNLLGSKMELKSVHILDDGIPPFNFSKLPRVDREAVLPEEVVVVRGVLQQSLQQCVQSISLPS